MENEGLKMKYFVLNPNKKDVYGDASRDAMLVYADAIQGENPTLARELRAWVLPIVVQIGKEQEDAKREAAHHALTGD